MIQCVQEIAKTADHLTSYIRTANISLPMGQRKMTPEEQNGYKAIYKTIFKACRQTATGLGYDIQEGTLADAPKRREGTPLRRAVEPRRFRLPSQQLRGYLVNQESNKIMYDYWAKKVRTMIKNPKKRALLAPEEAPYAFATKPSSLEQDYYECLDQDNVDIVGLKANLIREFIDRGVVCEDWKEHEFDVVVLATGYDSLTGSITSMGLRGKDGIDREERWKEGVSTYMDICVCGCPNMFMVYEPQASTAFTNGPVFIEVQIDFIADMIEKLINEALLPLTLSRRRGKMVEGYPRRKRNDLVSTY